MLLVIISIIVVNKLSTDINALGLMTDITVAHYRFTDGAT